MYEVLENKHSAKYFGQEMIEFLVNTKYEDLPPEVILRGKHIIMDAVACMLAGVKTRAMFNVEPDFLTAQASGDVYPVGCDYKTGPIMAAFLNNMHCQTHDYNDGLNNSGAQGACHHPGRDVVSAALAIGQYAKASGKEILTAVILGIEVASRMRNPAHSVNVAESYAAAAVSARLMGADKNQMMAAITLAGFTSPAMVGKIKPYNYKELSHKNAAVAPHSMKFAYALRAGVEAAFWAMNGYGGPDLDDNAAVTARYASRGLGKNYMCMDMYFKPWPCCRKTHGAIGAAMALHHDLGIKAEDVESIKVYQQIAGMYVNVPFDQDVNINFAGQFSIQYLTSCVFLEGDVTLKSFRREGYKAPLEHVVFAKKITVLPDNSLDGHLFDAPNHCVMEVTLKSGDVKTVYCKYPKGSEPNPMTQQDFEQKLRTAADWKTSAEQDEIIRKIMEIDK